MRTFLLTGPELTKLAFMAIVATALFGILGLLLIFLMQWMTIQTYALDGQGKHGISDLTASRLGGVSIALGVIFFMLYMVPLRHWINLSSDQIGLDWRVWSAGLGCFLIGLVEDLRNNSLSPKVRLLLKTLVLFTLFLIAPEIVPRNVGIGVIDWMLHHWWIAALVSLFFSVGFINAVNTVDGANGLLAGIFVFTCFIFVNEIDTYALRAGLYATSIFLLFNVVNGRLFLGDAGAYGVGAGMLITAIIALNDGIVSLSFLATLFFYPCFDFLVTLIRRAGKRVPLTCADNDHFHNRVNVFFQRRLRSKNLANSLTGLSISFASSGSVVVLYFIDMIQLNAHSWIYLFVLKCFIYLIIYFSLNRSVKSSVNI